MCREECQGGLVRSSAVKVEEGKHAYRKSLTGVGADDCRLPFRHRAEGGGVTRGGASAFVLRGLISGGDGLDGDWAEDI